MPRVSLHFAERDRRGYLNPLRPGALSPWLDFSSPTTSRVSFSSNNALVSRTRVAGSVDITAQVYDTPPVAFSGPWADSLVSPALIRWDVLERGEQVVRWRTPVDVLDRLEPNRRFSDVYAPGTRENRAGRPGCYRYYLARRFNTRTLADGPYLLEVEALDTRGNEALVRLPFRVINSSSGAPN